MKKQLKTYCIYIVLTILYKVSIAQYNTTEISWNSITDFDKTANKLAFVDVYTSWCGWCKELDKSTFKDSNFVKYINENYVAYKFDAEQKDDILFNQKLFHFNSKYNVHDLTIQFTGGRISYPLLLIINPLTHQVFPFPGYRPAKDFEIILKFFANTKIMTSDEFIKFRDNFVPNWK